MMTSSFTLKINCYICKSITTECTKYASIQHKRKPRKLSTLRDMHLDAHHGYIIHASLGMRPHLPMALISRPLRIYQRLEVLVILLCLTSTDD